jgi:hypothetical protein
MNHTYEFPQALQTNTLSPLEIERLARRRAGAKLGWFIHAAVYVCVNALLVTISFISGKPWAIFPLMGWGLGLAIHGAVVWLGSPGSALHERLLQQERQRLSLQRDPW